ncbi:uncharacterized protein LOC110893458 [Helianthus annuus]|uniref:uncharacterized protein LOC110893458 n=1 Tax=Helianthus annuus TaxID=4232 RepID=UPI000B8FB1B5|nr:uncharacterized protein LOC110893458 [Helianthus annuus]
MVLKSSSKLPRSTNYKVSDCKSKIKVKVFKGYPGLRLYEFVESHNHPLVSIENMDLTRKRRQLEFSDQDFTHRLSLAKVGPSIAFKMQTVLKGGQHNVRGVDHHNNCVTFAAALLYDETIESFTWMLEQFLEAHGKQPRLVLTDQDPAMEQAIAKVFNESFHRLYMWHIMDKLPQKIDGDVLQNTNLRIMLCFDMAIDGQRYRQRVFEHKTNSTSAVLSTLLPIEAHAALVYTRSIFKEVQKEISKALLSCMNGRPDVVDGFEHYTVSHFEKETVIGDYTVKTNLSDNSVTFSSPRWKKDALPKKVFNLEFCYGVDNSESFKLRSEALNLAQQCSDRLQGDSVKLAWFVEQIKAIKNKIFEEVQSDPSSKNKGGVFEELVGESQPESVSFVAPQGIRNKGCGKSRLLINPGEKAKVKSKKKKRNCKLCGKHAYYDFRNCPTKKKKKQKRKQSHSDEDIDEENDEDIDEDSDEDSHKDSDGE